MNKKRRKKECFVREYRNQLAEEGVEINFEEAEERYDAIRNLIRKSRNMSQLDIWKLEEMKPMEGFSEKDHDDLINLYKYLIENEV